MSERISAGAAMSEHAELVRLLRFDILSDKAQQAADAIEALGRQYEVRGEILTAAIERAEKAERLAGFALEAITFIRAIGRSTDPFPRTLAAQSFLERHGIPLTEDGNE